MSEGIVIALVTLKDGRDVEMVFMDYLAMSAWTHEHHDEFIRIRAKKSEMGQSGSKSKD